MTKAEQLHNALLKRSETRLTVPTPSIKKCQEILDELDKPELTELERRILVSLREGRGGIVRIADVWRWVSVNNSGCAIIEGYNIVIPEIIKDGLLETSVTGGSSGMTRYAYITTAGREAIA